MTIVSVMYFLNDPLGGAAPLLSMIRRFVWAVFLAARILVGQFWRLSVISLFHGCFLHQNIS